MPENGYKSITLKDDVYNKLKEVAEKNCRSMAQQIEHYIKTQDKEAQPLKVWEVKCKLEEQEDGDRPYWDVVRVLATTIEEAVSIATELFKKDIDTDTYISSARILFKIDSKKGAQAGLSGNTGEPTTRELLAKVREALALCNESKPKETPA